MSENDYANDIRNITSVFVTRGRARLDVNKTKRGAVELARKLTFKEVEEVYKDAGCELLSTIEEYKHSRSPLTYVCKCGKTTIKGFSNFRKDTRCRSCVSTEQWVDRKDTYEDVALYFSAQGCQLLSTTYSNSSDKLTFICSCGNQYVQSFFNFKKGKRCRDCSRKKQADSNRASIEEIKELFVANGCELISNEYTSGGQKLRFKAQCGHTNETKLHDFRSGKNRICANCYYEKLKRERALDYTYVKKFFSDHNCVLLEAEYINNSNKMRYVCECGNTSSISFASFRRGARCRKCMPNKIADAVRKYTIEDVRKIFKDRGCTLLETKYKNTKQLLLYVCTCGTEHKIRLTNFKDQGNSCPECKRKALSAENNYNWNPELTEVERERNNSKDRGREVSKWRSYVFERDNYTCQCCGSRGGGKLNAHHLDGYHWCTEGRVDVNNGVTLCEDCHKDFHKVHGNRYNTKEQYKNWIRKKLEQGA